MSLPEYRSRSPRRIDTHIRFPRRDRCRDSRERIGPPRNARDRSCRRCDSRPPDRPGRTPRSSVDHPGGRSRSRCALIRRSLPAGPGIPDRRRLHCRRHHERRPPHKPDRRRRSWQHCCGYRLHIRFQPRRRSHEIPGCRQRHIDLRRTPIDRSRRPGRQRHRHRSDWNWPRGGPRIHSPHPHRNRRCPTRIGARPVDYPRALAVETAGIFRTRQGGIGGPTAPSPDEETGTRGQPVFAA